jgi:hypothetical protein
MFLDICINFNPAGRPLIFIFILSTQKKLILNHAVDFKSCQFKHVPGVKTCRWVYVSSPCKQSHMNY